MLRRDFLVDVDSVEQGPRQGRIFDQRNLMLAGQFANPQSHLIGALGDHQRGRHGALVIFHGDREMGWVGNHHISGWHRLHHSLAGALGANLAQAGAHLGVALGLLKLVFDLLKSHAHLLHELIALVQKIDQRDDRQQRQDRNHQTRDQHQHHAQQVGHVHAQKGLQALHLRHQNQPHNAGHQRHLEDPFQQLDDRFQRKHALEPRDRRDAVELQFERFGGENEPALGNIDSHPNEHQQGE